MAKHNEILSNFKAVPKDEFDFSNKDHKGLVCVLNLYLKSFLRFLL